MEKVFKKGDTIVVTSYKDVMHNGVASDHWVCKYDRDLSFDEALDIHYKNMVKEYPGMNITLPMVEHVLKGVNDKWFLSEAGEVSSYCNHEVADSFDMLYLSGKYTRSEVADLKDKYIREFGITSFKFPGDTEAHFRVYEDISEWVEKQKTNE